MNPTSSSIAPPNRVESILKHSLAQLHILANDDPQAGTLLNNMAVAYHELGRFPEADAFYKRSLARWERTLPKNHTWIAQSLSNRAALYRDMEVYPEAERVFQNALAIWRSAGWPTTHDASGELDSSSSTAMPAWYERPAFVPDHVLPRYRTAVQRLKIGVHARDATALARLQQTIEKLAPWYHNVDLGYGIFTQPALGDYPNTHWTVLKECVPEDLSGETVLDVGCKSGFLSFKMKQRKAARVVGIDTMPWVLAQARFLACWFDYPVELYALSPYDVEQLHTRFDRVLFVGGLYRLKHPLYALESISSVCRETLYLHAVLRGRGGDFEPKVNYQSSETHIFDDPIYPRMYFIEKSLDGDGSNWWFPNRSCVKAMLRVAGFGSIEATRSPAIFVCQKPPLAPEQRKPSSTAETPRDDEVARIKDFWGNKSLWKDPNIVHWTQHPKVCERLHRLVSGEGGKNRFEYFMEKYCHGRMPFERVITLGCGHGELERGLSKYNFALAHDAVDLADASVEDATELAKTAGLTHIAYTVADLNTIELPRNKYDVVFGVSAIHHIARLEHLFDQVSRSLKPGGYFFLDEFIGPTQFQWTSEQLDAINDAIANFPEELKQCVDRSRGMKSPIIRLTIEEMNSTDPSEAIRSAEILPLLSQIFDIVEFRGCGGSLLHLLLEDIAGNFSESNPESMRYLESLFELEDHLIQSGRLQHDFAVIIAKKKAA